MAETKCNNICVSLTNSDFDNMLKIFKKKGHDVYKEPLAKMIREEIIHPYIEMETLYGNTKLSRNVKV